MSNNEFEFDKLVFAIALSIFTFVLSQNLAGLLYRSNNLIEERGYQIEVVDTQVTADAPKGIPDVIDIGALLAAGDGNAGKTVFNKCAICHNADKDGPNKVGPNLWGIIGRKTAIHEGFAYSNAMRKRGDDNKVWDFETLYRYLYSPAQFVPGTKMAFAGIKNDKDRADLIDYLRNLSDAPLPLPKPKSK